MTSTNVVNTVALLALVGSGLVAGVFFIFSVCIMRVLGGLPAAQGVATMQNINVVIINPWFLTAFLGTAALCVYVAIASVVRFDGTGSALLIGGSAAYVIGTFAVTMIFNVPRNDALAALQPDTAEAARYWAVYLTEWTTWNHVRTVASTAALALLAAALWIR
jgi:uncharacterized membrane protein